MIYAPLKIFSVPYSLEEIKSDVHVFLNKNTSNSLCVEGWRNLNHSYSLVNQWQLLKLVDSQINLRHKDLAYFNEDWNSTKNSSGLTSEQIKIINQIPSADSNNKYDVVYRISYPLDISLSNSDRLFVFGTSEWGLSNDCFIGSSVKEASSRKNLKIITPSNWSRTGFLKAGFTEENTIVIPHGVEPSSFYKVDFNSRFEYRKNLGIQPDDFVLLNIGALTSNKGVELLVKAYIVLKSKYKNLRLLIKDSSNLYGKKLENIVTKMAKDERNKNLDFSKLNDVITISQNLDIENLNRIYNSADAYVSPYYGEGFNLPALEAAACGIPILVTSGGATDDYFSKKIGLKIDSKNKHDANGNVYLLPNFDSLIDSLESLINYSIRCGGKIGSKYVHQNFSWEKVTDILINRLSL
tara:strand:+ start:274 stop:1503 length:1230 start_codon:yes stop_codon:yes gene_type:complete